MAGPLFGRETEVRTLECFLQRVPDGPRCLVLVGEPGVGKTALWETAVEDATDSGAYVLLHRAVEAEAAISFTGLADLVTPVFEDASCSLPEPQRRALGVALRLSEPGDEQPTDQLAIGLALLNLLGALARRAPLILAIDDLQWLDSSTAAVLGVALRRLRTEPLRLLATVRQPPGVDAPLDLDRSFRDGQLEKVTVGPLSLGDLYGLLKDRLNLELTRPELSRVWESAAGNPYLALELGRELVRTNTRPQVGRNLQPTPGLRDLLARRLAILPSGTLDVLLFAAALAQPSVELVARACGDIDQALASLELGRREGLIGFADARVRFTHPLLASVCYEEASPWKRRSVHRLLAETVTDPEERARHLALSSDAPDEGVASDLADAAQRAGSRGATAAAAELAELAVMMTPDDSQLDRRRRRMQAAAFHHLSGDLEREKRILDQLLNEAPPGVHRADVLYALALNGLDDMETCALFCQEAVSEARADDSRCAEILGFLSVLQWRLGEGMAAVESARAGLRRAERTKDARLLAVALARVGIVEDATLDLTTGLLERAMEIERGLDAPLFYLHSPKFAYANVMENRDLLDRSREILEDLDAAARSAGDEEARAWVALEMASLEWYAGRWERAQEQSAIALEFARQAQDPAIGSTLGRHRAVLEADLGLLREARQSAEEGLRCARLVSAEVGVIGNVAALGRIQLLAGDLQAAGTYLRDLPDRLLSAGWLGPDSVDLWPDSIETLIRLGELERAEGYLETFEEFAPQASRRWVACAARCRGLFAAAERDAEAAFDHLQRALSELEAIGYYPLDRGRTLLVLGSVRRQVGRKAPARDALEKAFKIFDDLGARSWLSWAAEELGRISGRRAPSHALTETEVRVATLASQGLSNHEIAVTLFMGLSTVEAHLSRVYGKLGVRRAGLATSLRALHSVR